jgi:hypothetical protein
MTAAFWPTQLASLDTVVSFDLLKRSAVLGYTVGLSAVITGKSSSPSGTTGDNDGLESLNYIRVSYNLDDTAQLAEGIKRLGALLRALRQSPSPAGYA